MGLFLYYAVSGFDGSFLSVSISISVAVSVSLPWPLPRSLSPSRSVRVALSRDSPGSRVLQAFLLCPSPHVEHVFLRCVIIITTSTGNSITSICYSLTSFSVKGPSSHINAFTSCFSLEECSPPSFHSFIINMLIYAYTHNGVHQSYTPLDGLGYLFYTNSLPTPFRRF